MCWWTGAPQPVQLLATHACKLAHDQLFAATGTPLFTDVASLGEFGGGEYIDEYRLHEAVADGATLPIKYLDAWVALAADAGLDQAFKDQFAHLPEARQLALQRELLRRWREASGRMAQVAAHLVEQLHRLKYGPRG